MILTRGDFNATYDEIASALNISRQRVIQIEREALRKYKLAYINLMRINTVDYKWEPGEDD